MGGGIKEMSLLDVVLVFLALFAYAVGALFVMYLVAQIGGAVAMFVQDLVFRLVDGFKERRRR